MCRSVDTNDGVTQYRKIARHGDARTAAEIEDPPPIGWQAVDKTPRPFLPNGRYPKPFEICVCNVVITYSDKMPGIFRHRRTFAGGRTQVEL
ncbi:hypothetical protein BIWAKO_00040 [Bosea sp. BIWAKO-01]|nr:hypothetical protein BIWAKO_00040 [Bosea sp. BIWAKO-01]